MGRGAGERYQWIPGEKRIVRIKPRPLEIRNETGFGEKDLLARKDFADRLINLVKNIEDPTVFLLDAPWGNGKTTFLKQWAGELRRVGIPVVAFDAFARDYQADPFIALSSEVLAAASKVEQLKEDIRKDFVEKAKELGKTFLPSLTQILISKASMGVLSAEDVKKLSQAPPDSISAILKERLEAAEAEAELLSSFREALEKLAKGMSVEGEAPLVLIVDELDRCRPSFAVEIIEKVKHVFAVPGVHFVLAAHLPQLAKVFQNAYGLGSEQQALTYLEKFYDVSLRFPTLPLSSDTETKRYISYLWDELGLPEDISSTAAATLECIFHNRQVSLRTIEKIMTNIALYCAGGSKISEGERIYAVGICCIRHFDPTLFGKIASSSVTWEEVNEFFGFDNWSEKGAFPRVRNLWGFPFGQCADENLGFIVVMRPPDAKAWLSEIAARIDNLYPGGP